MQWQIAAPVTLLLVLYAHFRKALTPTGIVAAAFTALVHAKHPWNLPFTLLVVFFLTGTGVTKIKKSYKATLTLSASGGGGEGPRNHTQVFANSLVGTALTWMHTQQLRRRERKLLGAEADDVSGTLCYSWMGDILPIGIMACYAAAAADTFSSELGILARSEPRLITDAKFRKVPRGTNGGVTIEGLLAGLLGSSIIAAVSFFLLPICDESSQDALGGGEPWSSEYRVFLAVAVALWGVLGSVFDSWLGATFQRTVKDVRTGKVVEGDGGTRAMTTDDEEEKDRSLAAMEARRKAWEQKERAATGDASGSQATEQQQSDELKSREKTPGKEDEKPKKPSFPSRVAENGPNALDNNDVNFAMSFFMSLSAMGVACQVFGTTFGSIQDL